MEGTISFKKKVHIILNNYADCFCKTVGSKPAKVNPLVLQVDEKKWYTKRNTHGPRIQSVLKEKAIHEFIEHALADDIIEVSQAPYVSQVLLTPKL